MIKYRGAKLIRPGFLGLVLILLIITVGLQPERIGQWATSVRYQAVFAEAGGIAVGNDVTVAGIKVGTVSGIELHNDEVLLNLTVDGTVRLKSETTAHIRTGSLLGERLVTLEPQGDQPLAPQSVIPETRTSSPYSLTDAVGELTTNTAGTDTATLNQSLDTLSTVLDQIAPQLGPAFDGLTRLSASLNSRDNTLGDLLGNASDVAAILGERSTKVNTLILNANDLVAVLNERRHVIVALLASTSSVAQQLSAMVADNEAELAPTLQRLNEVTEVLERNRDNISRSLPTLAKYLGTQGETVANGAYYNAYISNLVPGQLLQPFLDYAFGFRRGVNQGQPPDNAGPRAELPFPYNGIPGGSR